MDHRINHKGQLCHGPIFGYDDFKPCYRHLYLQYIPLIILGGSSALILSIGLSHRALKSKCNHLKLSRERPLLADPSAPDNDSGSTSSSQTSLSISVTHDASDHREISPEIIRGGFTDGHMSGQAVVATVVRSTAERLRVSCETITVALQVALHLLALWTPEVNREWSKETFNTPLVLIAFWTYLFILVVTRLSYMIRLKTPQGDLWTHSTFLYSGAWLLSSSQLYSAIYHPVSEVSRRFNFASVGLSTILVCLNYSAKIGDKPGKLYLASNGAGPSPEPISSLFQLITFSWIDPLIWKGYWNYLNMEDVWELRADDHAKQVLDGYRTIKKASGLAWRMSVYFKSEIFLAAIFALVQSIGAFGPSILLKEILEYVEDPTSTSFHVALLYAVLVFVIPLGAAICSGQALFIGRRVCIRIRAIIMGEVYAKGLRRKVVSGHNNSLEDKEEDKKVSDEESQNSEDKSSKSGNANLGTIINLMSVDAMKVSEVCAYLHQFVSSIIIIGFTTVFLYSILSWSALIGGSTFIIIAPLNYWFARRYGALQSELMAITDERVEKTNELLQSIRIIKFFAWEDKFADGVYEIRSRELYVLWKRALLWVIGGVIWFVTPLMMAMFSFGSYTLIQQKVLTTPVAFASLSLFNVLRSPMDQLAEMISEVVQSKVSVDRVDKFLNEAETTKYRQLSDKQPRGPDSPYIGFEKATFSWVRDDVDNDTNDFKLRDLDIKFDIGKLNVIVGPTGSGKSSLLLALLGEMELDKGRVYLPCHRRDCLKPDSNGLIEAVAYCSQQAWLLNDTLKNNILFASPYDEDRYNKVIEVCALTRDLEILDSGDETEIGEKGITLSGGQKQRISLARAIYSNSAHLLLDDCLSAVDSHTALHIYEKCLTGPLCSNRTIILVSHNVALTIKDASMVIVMDNGRVKAQGHPSIVVEGGALGEDELVRASASANVSQSATRVGSEDDLSKSKKKSKSLADELGKSLIDAAKKAQKEQEPELERPIEEEIDDEPIKKKEKSNGKLMTEEERATGDVKLAIYGEYIKLLGNPISMMILLSLFILNPISSVLQNWWIREWTRDLDGETVRVMGVSMGVTRSLLGKIGEYINIGGYTNFWGYHFNIGGNIGGVDVEPLAVTSSHHGSVYYLTIYFLLGLLYLLVSSVREFMAMTYSLRASKLLFQKVLHCVLRAKVRFFDSTPIGRIINRFSKDIEGVDQDLAPVYQGAFSCLLAALTVMILIVFVTPQFIVAAIILSGVYWAIGTFYLITSRELKRLESISKSPIYQQFGETLVGVATIRAYGEEERFIQQNLDKINNYNRPFFYMWVANRWLSFRVDLAGSCVTFLATLFVILSTGRIDAGWAGLSLSYALNFNENMLWIVRLYSALEMNMNSVERLLEYTNIEPEAPEKLDTDERLGDDEWPNKGVIEVKDLSLRYAPNLPTVIKNVSFKVDSSNKVGIVGRTGAGKSTIITALFRFLEPETGTIEIDGVDITKLGLNRLRRGLAIIPQDPTLFAGTIRSNLDPFGQYKDDEIFEALMRVHLIGEQKPGSEVASSSKHDDTDRSEVANGSAGDSEGSKQSDTLDSPNDENVNQFLNLDNNVSEGGNNLSQGQRQLMCLARSLLKSPKVLLLDEATASIDYETDSKIQNTIRTEFSNSTILTIAHRLRSIIDYDKILVMDAGQAVEYDHPHVLLSDKKSIFYDMCSKSGELESLLTLAEEKYKENGGR